MNFDEFKEPLPPKKKGEIDDILDNSRFFVHKKSDDVAKIDERIRDVTNPQNIGDEQYGKDEEEDAPRKFPEPFGDLEEDSPTQKEFDRRMRESQGPEREEQGELIEDKRYSQTADPEEDVREIVDPDFLNGRMISSEIISFWPIISEENFQFLSPKSLEAFIHPMPYYRQDFEERRDEFLQANNNKEALAYYGEDNYKKMVDFQNGYVRRIMELSDPNQVRKYDKLVDEFNADRERIIRERDYEGLQGYIAKVKALIRETK